MEPTDMATSPYWQQIGFGGSCHWCTEAIFQALRGVHEVRQGFIASDGDNQSWSEAVLVHFTPTDITQHDLIEIHLHTHSSTAKSFNAGQIPFCNLCIQPATGR